MGALSTEGGDRSLHERRRLQSGNDTSDDEQVGATEAKTLSASQEPETDPRHSTADEQQGRQ
ncbi:hypothetical protein GCM10017714_22650 [Curtobacterium pusillum]